MAVVTTETIGRFCIADEPATVCGDNAFVLDSGTGNRIVLDGDNANALRLGDHVTLKSSGAGNFINVVGTDSVLTPTTRRSRWATASAPP